MKKERTIKRIYKSEAGEKLRGRLNKGWKVGVNTVSQRFTYVRVGG